MLNVSTVRSTTWLYVQERVRDPTHSFGERDPARITNPVRSTPAPMLLNPRVKGFVMSYCSCQIWQPTKGGTLVNCGTKPHESAVVRSQVLGANTLALAAR